MKIKFNKILLFAFFVLPFLFLPLMDYFNIFGSTGYHQRLNAKVFGASYYLFLFVSIGIYKKWFKKNKKLNE